MNASKTSNSSFNDSSLGSAGEPMVVAELPGIVTVPELADLLEISPSTAYRWIRFAACGLSDGSAVPVLRSVSRFPEISGG